MAKVKKRFGSIAPDSLWEQFDTCDSTGLDNAYECSGPAVGQFQLFDSKSKAASTTQVLEELRSSTVLEDNGRYIVGWSTLGTSAVITVVDNEEGLVMQQLVSSDIVDPEEHIKKLGLTLPPGDEKGEKAADQAEPKEISEEQKPAH
ncbi:hypothetical protein FHE74_04110 [Corynebacterium tapiri]|uniref:Uncharacterized protein n=1 Tax=Corynebacterium tapiri TaxID=1448266 RepID=A0A5C4U5V2_9CORY|nr:hypothetical protein FHE74_04110 [Corynebacterium tapiri]